MPGIAIVTDSSSDLTPETAEKHGIEIVPLTVRFGDAEFVDRQDLSPTDFWKRMANASVLPETAAPSPGAFETAFRRAADQGHAGVVCISISGELSATIQSAQLAAQAIADDIPVRVVDSRSVTSGLGMIAISAARLAEEGAQIDKIASHVEELAARTRVFAALNTLENLKKGGRIGGAQALLGSLLSIKPIIEVRQGAVEPESKQRTRLKSLRYLADKVRAHAPVDNLAVMHGAAPDVDELLSMLDDVYPRSEIAIGEIGAVIGTHAGPGVIGVTFQIRN